MIVLQVNGITKSFSGTDILQNVRLEVQHRDRVALVGRNGAGKSTLLKIIAGEMSADSGDLIMPKDVQVGYLEQHAGIDSSLTIWDEMLTVFTPLLDMEKRLRNLEAQMADPSVYENSIEYERVMKDYDALQIEFKDSGDINMNQTCAPSFTACAFIQRTTTKVSTCCPAVKKHV